MLTSVSWEGISLCACNPDIAGAQYAVDCGREYCWRLSIPVVLAVNEITLTEQRSTCGLWSSAVVVMSLSDVCVQEHVGRQCRLLVQLLVGVGVGRMTFFQLAGLALTQWAGAN
jgi:hypothetical protein